MSEFTVVPILENFQHERVIGELRIRTDALPLVPAYVFSLGFKILGPSEAKPGDTPRQPYVGPYELMSVSPVPDDNYIALLRQTGKLPPEQELTTFAEAERRLLFATLDHFNGDKPKAAASLGVSLKTIYNHLARNRRS